MTTYLPNPTCDRFADSGPRVFVTDGELGRYGQPIGVWLDLNQTLDEMAERLRTAGIVPARMVIIDQVGLGPIMIDQDCCLCTLHDWAQR